MDEYKKESQWTGEGPYLKRKARKENKTKIKKGHHKRKKKNRD